jgi:ABC-type Na+ transport system ATPase subunit NatA
MIDFESQTECKCKDEKAIVVFASHHIADVDRITIITKVVYLSK